MQNLLKFTGLNSIIRRAMKGEDRDIYKGVMRDKWKGIGVFPLAGVFAVIGIESSFIYGTGFETFAEAEAFAKSYSADYDIPYKRS